MNRVERLMARLYDLFRVLLEQKWFDPLCSLVIFVNPIALFPQVVAAFTTAHPEEIVVLTWGVISCIQLAIVLQSLKTRTANLFFSMLLCLIETTTIVVVVCIRRF